MLLTVMSPAFIAFADDDVPETESEAADTGAESEQEGPEQSEPETQDEAEPPGDAEAPEDAEVPEDDDDWDIIGDSTEVEDDYVDATTLYDLELELDLPIVPELLPPPPPPPPPAIVEELVCPVCGESFNHEVSMLSTGDDVVCPACGEVFGYDIEVENFDAENAAQLRNAAYVMDELIIKFKEPWQVPGKEKQLQREIEKVQKVGFVEEFGFYVIKADDLRRDPNRALNRYKNNKFIEFVEPNYTATAEATPNDTLYNSMVLALTSLNAIKGWDIISGGSGPIIAVVDSGVAAHPDLPPLLPGYAAVAGLSPNNDKSGHGTGVAGTIGAVGNNKLGVVGLNWGASIMPVKVDDANNSYSAANFAKGIIWAADNGAKIISTSISFTSDSATIKSAIDYAYNKGCAIFASAGNNGTNGLNFPARYPNVMAVGGSSNSSTRASVSNYGAGMGVLAITSYYTTTATGGYSVMSGTSFSTPQVSGLASLILALNPKLTNEQVYDLIRQSAKGGGRYVSDEIGYGFINVEAALKLTQATLGSSAAAEAEAAAKAAAEKAAAEAAAQAAAEAAAKAAAEKAAAEAAAQAAAEAAAQAAAEKAAAEAAAQAAAEAAAQAAAEAAAEAAAQAAAEAEAAAKAAAEKAAAEAAAQAAAEAAAQAAAEAAAEAAAQAAAQAAAEAAALAAALPPETPPLARTPPVIILTGFSNITLEYGQAYDEMGYFAEDCQGKDLTSEVMVSSTVDIWTAGLYSITYEVEDSTGLTARVTRTVTVAPQPVAPPPPTAPKITIIGSNPIILHSTSSTVYREQSAKAVDGDGKDISNLVQVSGNINRTVPGTYTITYRITSPTSGLTSTTTRNVRIVGPTERREPRTKYGFSGQAKQGAKVTHTGVVSSALGFVDLQVSSIDKNMTITAQFIDTATKKVILTDTFSAAGTKQYKIDKGKYELVVAIDKANGNSKYGINLTMPESEPVFFFDTAEVPLRGLRIAPIGSNPIILHIGGTPYTEQGARAVDVLGLDISDRVITEGVPDTTVAGTYVITYTVYDDAGKAYSVTRDVRILDPNDETTILEAEVPLADILALLGIETDTYTVVSGDSLAGIARKIYGDWSRWREIYDLNKAVIGNNPNLIYVGQTLILPMAS